MADEEILYDKGLKIIYKTKADAHHLIIEGKYIIVLERGVLDELSRTPFDGLREKLDTVNPDTEEILKNTNLTYERIGFALVQARMIEVEEELKKAYSLR